MLTSQSLDSTYNVFGPEKAIEMFAEAGFDAFDYSMFDMFDRNHPLHQSDYKDYIAKLKTVADRCGIVCNQAHAPFGSSFGEPGEDEYRFQTIVRAMESAALLGAKIIVVHPKQHLEYWTHVEELKEMNINFYKRLIPYCEKFNIKVAAENMFQIRDGVVVDSTCANPKEFREYLDLVDSPWIVACMDVGHVAITHHPYDEYVDCLGDKLQAIHLHDNDCNYDYHIAPCTGNIDMDFVSDQLKRIGYKGDITCEVVIHDIPNEEFPEKLKFICDRAGEIREKIL